MHSFDLSIKLYITLLYNFKTLNVLPDSGIDIESSQMVTCLLRPDDCCENEPCRDDCELKYPPPTAPKLR